MTDYLVQFGRSAYVGRFSFAGADPLPRGSAAVIKTVRGLEVGTVLCPSAHRFADCTGESAGHVERIATNEDHGEHDRRQTFARDVLDRADACRGELPVHFVEAEATLDGQTVILHVIPLSECDLSPLLTTLSQTFHTHVTLQDLSRPTALPDAPDAVEGGCGKPNCGSESGSGGGCSTGGCSTGNCSRGKVKSAEELTDYFADLRRKMESTARDGRLTLN